MNLLLKPIYKMIAHFSMAIENLSTRSTCYWGFYEPELPSDQENPQQHEKLNRN